MTENLVDYLKRFKQLRDILKSYLGDKILDIFIENSTEYRNETDTTKQQEMKDNAWERWMSYLFLDNSDKTKYGSLITSFQSQFSLGNNQWPQTLITATDALSQHKFDQQYYNNRDHCWNQRQQQIE